jgi:RNA polymerase sigma-32 factor
MRPELSWITQQAASYDLLSLEREQELSLRWRDSGDRAALDELVGSHLRLVVKVARRFAGYGHPLEELVSEGCVGLMQAAERFDPDRGNRFSTYAMWWIRAAIQEYILRSASLVRMGTTATQKRLFFNLRRMKSAMGEHSEGDMSPEATAEIAEILGVDAAEVTDMDRRMSGSDQSLNANVSGEGDSEFLDLLEAEDPSPEALLVESDERAKRQVMLADALAQLDERERHIVTERRLAEDKQTLEELGQAYGISRERVRQLEARAVRKLETAMRQAAAGGGTAGLLREESVTV